MIMRSLQGVNQSPGSLQQRARARFFDGDLSQVLAAPRPSDRRLYNGPSFRHGFKRAVDIALACAGILFLSPLMILIAVAVKLSSPGPVFFTQRRAGLKGRPFTLLKFRTMVDGCKDNVHRDYVTRLIKGEGGAIGKQPVQKPMSKLMHDERITAIGRFLRAWSLDELPQLFNVLKGEMSLVGPRPALPYEVTSYREWHRRRLDAVPGITGLWQVRGRNTVTFDEMVRMDISYIEHWSPGLDLKILLQTFSAVLRRQGAA
jgi:lipopolysaccharide/colanic/teichoic acid biosynthesis glycosyltransferase